MDLTRRILRGGATIAFAQIAQQGLLFVRTAIVGRILAPHEFGLALTFLTVSTAIEAITDLGTEYFIIRSKHAGDPRMQSTVHTWLVFRAVFSAALIFLLAHPIASLFGAEHTTWAYRLLALVPLLRGFLHLDTKRYERDLRFGPNIVNNLVSAAVGAVATVVAVYLTQSHVGVVIGMIVQVACLVAGSHLLAERPYRYTAERSYVNELWSFGGPLMLNSLILVLYMQGDRLLIGWKLSLTDLGRYGTVAVLTSGVSIVLSNWLSSLFLPLLSNNDPKSVEYDSRYRICGAVTLMLTCGIMIAFATLGRDAVHIAFGSKYGIDSLLVTWMGIQTAFRIQRIWPQIAFIAASRTKAALLTNAVSAAGLIGAVALVFLGHGLNAVAMSLAIGEMAAGALSIVIDHSASPAAKRQQVGWFVASVLLALGLVAGHHFGVFLTNIGYELVLAAVLSLGAAAAICVTTPILSIGKILR